MEVKFFEEIPLERFKDYDARTLKEKALKNLRAAAMDKIMKSAVITMQEKSTSTLFHLDMVCFTRPQFKDIVKVLQEIKASMEKKEDPLIHLKNLCDALRV